MILTPPLSRENCQKNDYSTSLSLEHDSERMQTTLRSEWVTPTPAFHCNKYVESMIHTSAFESRHASVRLAKVIVRTPSEYLGLHTGSRGHAVSSFRNQFPRRAFFCAYMFHVWAITINCQHCREFEKFEIFERKQEAPSERWLCLHFFFIIYCAFLVAPEGTTSHPGRRKTEPRFAIGPSGRHRMLYTSASWNQAIDQVDGVFRAFSIDAIDAYPTSRFCPKMAHPHTSDEAKTVRQRLSTLLFWL